MSDHDDESCLRCPLSQPTARVEDNEDIALIVYHNLLCDENGKPVEGAFPFNVLLLKNRNSDQYPHNKCGESEGVSIERDVATRKNELIERCKQLSKEKTEKSGSVQIPKGFAVAKVKDLRQIRFATNETVTKNKTSEVIFASEQVVFVLADGRPDKPNHSVMRLHKKLDRPLYKKILQNVMSAFRSDFDWTTDATNN